jgi:hypothetical protein
MIANWRVFPRDWEGWARERNTHRPFYPRRQSSASLHHKPTHSPVSTANYPAGELNVKRGGYNSPACSKVCAFRTMMRFSPPVMKTQSTLTSRYCANASRTGDVYVHSSEVSVGSETEHLWTRLEDARYSTGSRGCGTIRWMGEAASDILRLFSSIQSQERRNFAAGKFAVVVVSLSADPSVAIWAQKFGSWTPRHSINAAPLPRPPSAMLRTNIPNPPHFDTTHCHRSSRPLPKPRRKQFSSRG